MELLDIDEGKKNPQNIGDLNSGGIYYVSFFSITKYAAYCKKK